MSSRLPICILSLLFLITSSLPQLVRAQTGVDFVIPEVQLVESPNGRFTSDQVLVVRASDNTGITQVSLFFRLDSKQPYRKRAFETTGEQNLYRVQIPLTDKFAGRVQYYVSAQDAAGNLEFYGQAESPISFLIVSDSQLANKLGAGGELNTLPTADASAAPFYRKKSVLYTVLGVLAVGALAAAASDGGSSGGGAADCDTSGCNLTITTPTISQ